MKWCSALYALQSMWIVHPGQASSLQGHRSVSCGVLAGNDWGTGSGWQQSRQNSTLLAVTGHWTRMQCRVLWRILSITTPAGFDSKISETVSIPRTEMMTRKPYFNPLNGEDKYALAA